MGFAKPEEVFLYPRRGYPFIKGGVELSKDSVKVDLYVNDEYDKKIYGWPWNGSYPLRWGPDSTGVFRNK